LSWINDLRGMPAEDGGMARTWIPGLALLLASALAAASPLGPDGEAGRVLPGKFVWLDLATEDPARARAFYGAVFGWTFRDAAGSPAPYTLIESPHGKVGGMFRRTRPAGASVGARWLGLVSVRDPAQAARYVRRLGGEVLVAPVTIPGRGTHAVLRDPQGAAFGVMRSEGDPTDDPVADGELFWMDLFSSAPREAAEFYAGLAGYATDAAEGSPRPRFILSNDGIARAGVVSAGNGPPGWLPYILVDDVPAALGRATRAGGRVLLPPRENVLGGNVAIIADPTGGAIGMVNWTARVDARSPRR
jgi:predicted enzyme related to lactoylglutathione lyase